MKLVSVIIPAYNKAEYTRRTVESVLAQTYSSLEVIVVDDGSTDNTAQVMAAFKDRIRYILKPNGGACSARNAGIKASSGEYIAFIDCDDLYEPRKIEVCADYLNSHPEYGFVHTAANLIDHQERVEGIYDHPKSRRLGWITRRLILGNHICNSTALIRREILFKAGFFDESIFTPGDWDLWLRLSETAQVGYIREPLTKYRITDNYIFNRLELAQREELYVIEKFFQRHPDGRLRARALSNLHLRFAQCHYVKNDGPRYHEAYTKSLQLNPLNFKAILMGAGALVASKNLKTELTRRILRYSTANEPAGSR
ncbi:MAG: glycosyltransferase [Candidatus Omnitrophica bacterium]|nr:glycosyltransferase [Candidatus Omnitrophota bacterium]